MDAHAEDEVDVRRERSLCGRLRSGLGIEGQPDLEALLTCEGDDAPQVRASLVVDGDAVGARLAELLEVALRRLGHQVAVEHAACSVDDRRDRLEHDRPRRDRWDEMAVADVEVEDAHFGAEQDLDLLAKPGEVGRVERRLDLDGADPVLPAHLCVILGGR